ncbi:hypothetical protein [Bordetella sp. LUAb4]|uniref:hypothetical protein n=1 Tax=Bordetella sp. LUAb4 TaxID=2843195 RepID=UPI001E50E9A8|nr:hypothetical protein [Bordetella sp. LUAb4]
MDGIKAALDYLSLGWVGTILGIIGIGLSVYFYLAAKSNKRLYWCHEGSLLLGRANGQLPPGITVQYYDQQIPRLTRTRVWIWNPSDPTIHRADIESTDPLRIHFDTDGQILAATVQKSHRNVTGFFVAPAPNSATDLVIEFNFLDRDDGALVEILHTGSSVRPELMGTVRGIPKGFSNKGSVGSLPPLMPLRMRRALRINPVILGISLVLAGVVMLISSVISSEQAAILDPAWLKAAVGATYVVFGLAFTYRVRRRHPKALEL